MLVVVLLLAAILALALPRLGHMRKGVVIKQAGDTIRSAFRDAAIRARATGTPVRLELDTENSILKLGALPDAQTLPAVPPPSGGARNDETQPAGVIARLNERKVPTDIDWEPDDGGINPEAKPAYSFYPGGEASGPTLEFSIKGSRFRLDVDRLTGRPLLDTVSE